MPPYRRLAGLWFLPALFSVAFAFSPQLLRSAPQLPPQWSAAVNSLAEKIAAAGGTGPLAMNMTNSSSLSTSDASNLYNGVLASLRARHFSIVGPELATGPDTRVQITFSENATGYVWVAEIMPAHSTDRQVAMVSAPKLAGGLPGNQNVTVVLNRKVVWSQPGKMLDFVLFDPATPSARLVILEADRIAFYSAGANQWDVDGSVPISHAAAWPRDLSGTIDPQSGKVTLENAQCEGDVIHPDGLHCTQMRRNPARVLDTNEIRSVMQDRAGDVVNLGSVCSDLGPLLLATGTADWSQPDHLQIYDAVAQRSLPLGQPFEFPGPILAMGLSADRKSMRVVSRNLQTGMYEASIVTASCGN